MIFLSQILLYSDPLCDWSTEGFVWSSFSDCNIGTVIDSTLLVATADVSVANIFDLYKSSGNYSLANLTGQIKHMYIFVNTSINITDPTSYITLFDYISGSMTNVTLSGFINITVDVSNPTSLFFAPFGNFLYDLATQNAKFVQIYSDLQFRVNGMLVTFDGQYFNGTIKTRLLTNFNQKTDVTRKMTFTTPPLNYIDMLRQHKLYVELVDKTPYYCAFDAFNSKNLHIKYYELPFRTLRDFKYLLNGAVKVKLDALGNQVTDNTFTTIVYTTDAKAFVPKGLMCGTNSYFKYDGTCTTNLACSGFIFKHMCLKACPTGQYTLSSYIVDSKDYCQTTCPQHLGYVSSGQTCVYSPNSSCTGGDTLFQKGCYQTMPNGLVLWIEPQNEQDCLDASFKYFVQQTTMTYSYCTNNAPDGYYFHNKTFTIECNDFVLPTRECAKECSQEQILITGSQKFCQYSCSFNFGSALFNNNGECAAACSDSQYAYKNTCLKCTSAKDGGLHFNQTNSQCMTCAQVKYDKQSLVCTTTCPFTFNSICYDSCPPQTFTDGTNCVLNCANQIQDYQCTTCSLSFNQQCRSQCSFYEYELAGQCKSRSRDKYGRIWNYTESYNLDEIGNLDLSIWENFQTNTNGDSSIPLGVVNVLNLISFGNSYHLIRVNSGSIKNAKFVVNVTLDFSKLPQPDETIICILESVNGIVNNIEITGEVRIKNVQSTGQKLILSNAFGSVQLRNGDRTMNGSFLSNIKTNLKFYIDDNIVTSNTTNNGVQVVLVSCKEEAMTDLQLSPFTAAGLKLQLDSTDDISTQVSNNQLYKQEIKLVDQTFEIYTQFDAQNQKMKNIFADYYISPFLLSKEIQNEIIGMKQYNFDVFKNIIDLQQNSANIKYSVFASLTKAVVLENKQFSFRCQGNQIVDITSLTCIQRSQCASNRYILDSLCLKSCLKGQFYLQSGSINICYDQCPNNLGYRNPLQNNFISQEGIACVYCPNYAFNQYCLTSCAYDHFTFQKGCYNVCPVGTLISGQTCTVPASQTSCISSFFVRLSLVTSLNLYDICSPIMLPSLYKHKTLTNTYVPVCSGKVLLNQTCDTTSALPCTDVADISYTPLTQTISGSSMCTLQCDAGMTNSSGSCINTCSELYYQQLSSGNCLTCQQNIYDTGIIWDRLTKKCVPSCVYFNRTLCNAAAINPLDLTKCSFNLTEKQIVQISCIRTCQYQSSQALVDACILNCPQQNTFIEQLGYPICEQPTNTINCAHKLVIIELIEYSCIDRCPIFTFIYQEECHYSCPTYAKYIDTDGLTCVPTCANSLFTIIKDQLHCLDSCSLPLKTKTDPAHDNYLQCYSSLELKQFSPECQFIQSMLWGPTNQICKYQNSSDFSSSRFDALQYVEQQFISQWVYHSINVVDFIQRSGTFLVLELTQTAQINNGLLVVNVTIDMSSPANANLNAIKVCLFDQVLGSLNNISVTGFVNITNFDKTKTTSVVLSKLFGNVLLTGADRVVGGSFFTNVSSNLQFFINNNEVVQDNQTFTGLEGVSIRYVQSFEEVTSSSFAVGLLPYGATVSGMLAANPQVLYSSPLSYVDWRTGNKAEKLIYTAFDPVLYKNALNDFYGGAFLQYQEKMRQVNGLAKVSFDKYDLIIPVVDASSDVRTVIYNSESKAVILQDQRFPVVCTQGQIADIISKKCIDRTACTGQRYVFNSICVKQCPVSYRLVQILDSSSAPLYNICYASCPQWLGYRDPDVIDLLDSRNNTCVKCAAGQLAKQASCAATCQSPMFTFEKGCYATCPLGTVVAGLVCSQPTQASDCNTNYYVKLNDILPGQYYDICQASLPTDKYRDAVTANKFSWKCTGKVLLSGICDTTSALGCTSITDSLYKVVSNSLQGTKFCQMSCIDGLLNNSNTCSNQAEDLRYPQYSTGSSLTCDLTAYDTGNMYDRLNKVCVTSCNYRNHTKIGIICEQQTDFINCPKRMEVEPGIFQCFDKCPLNKLELSSVCISSCPADNIYIQLDGRSCSTSCQPGEMIKVYKTEVQCVAQCVYPFKVISQSVYGSYSQCIQIYTIPQLKGGCDWVFTSRIWDPQEMCDIPATIDFLQWTNYQTQLAGTGINMGVVNVVNLVQINTLFQAFNIPAAKVLKNGLLVVNVTIDMSSPANANLNAIKVCLFDQVLGSLNNISVTGFVNITNFDKTKTTSVVLSKLFGNVLLTGADRVVGGSFFTNVSSNLQFFINNNEVVQDNQTFTGLEGVSIRYVQSFEEVTSSSFAVGLLPYGATVSGMLAANPQVLYSSPLSYVDWRTGNKAEKLIYTAFDPVLYKNALNDFYGGAFLQYQEKMRQVNGLAKVSFDKYDLIIPVVDASSDVRTVIYNSESKAVILQDQRFPVVCTQGQIADIISKKCIDRTACTGQRYVFNSICVKQCPVSYRLVQILDSSSAPLYNICYASCPQWLGYRDPNVIDLLDSRNNTCVKCAAGQLAKQASCAATCQSPMFTFEKGCYATCPLGTVVAGLVCSQPTQASDCNTNYYVKLNDILPGQYYDICQASLPTDKYRDAVTANKFSWKCTGKVLLSGICDTTSALGCTSITDSLYKVVSNSLQGTKFCQMSCIDGLLNNSNTCSNKCNDLNYPQYYTGSCMTCDLDLYDSGTYWDRTTMLCQTGCTYLNTTKLDIVYNICEDKMDAKNCPSKTLTGSIHVCTLLCAADKFRINTVQDDFGECVDSCTVVSNFLQVDQMNCDTSCLTGFVFQQSDGRLTCKQDCLYPYSIRLFSNNQQECYNQQVIYNNKGSCDWMLSTRTWLPQQECSLISKQIDYNTYNNKHTNVIDLSVVNIYSLINVNGIFKAINLGTNSIISNAVFVVNTTIDISNQQDSKVCIFDNVLGQVKNVSVYGVINIIFNSQVPKTLIISKMFGTVPRSQQDRQVVNGGPYFEKLTSGLQYFVNGVEITSNTTIQNIQIKIVNSFEEAMTQAQLGYPPANAVMQLISATIQSQIVIKKLYSNPASILVNSSYQLNTIIYTGFNKSQYTNSYLDYYTQSFSLYLEMIRLTQNLQLQYISRYSTISSVFDEQGYIVYTGPTIAVLTKDFKGILICQFGKLLNFDSESCIEQSQCQGFVIGSLCVKICPSTYKYIKYQNVKYCQQSCPLYLGYRDPVIDISAKETQQCIKCEVYASTTQCLTQCGSQSYLFKMGCYSICPSGTLIKGTGCFEPIVESDCTQYFVKVSNLNNYQLYDYCTQQIPTGLYQNSNTFTWKCDQYTSLENVCIQNPICTTLITENVPVINNKTCALACIQPLVNNSGFCQINCIDGYYSSLLTGSCNQCLNDVYDGGKIWNRNTQTCLLTDSCTYLNTTRQYPQICEQYQTQFCQIIMNITTIQFRCELTCDLGYFNYSGKCYTTCPSNSYLQTNGMNCDVCQSNIIKIQKDNQQCVDQCQKPLQLKAATNGNQECYLPYHKNFTINCDWVFTSRIWDPQEMCDIPATIDFLQWTNYQTQLAGTGINMGVVNVVNLVQINTLFQAFNIPAAKVLKNGLLVVNVTIDMSSPANANLNAIKVCLFDQVLGSLNNISVTGFVNITNFDKTKTTSVVLSKLFGNVLLTGADRVVGGSFFTNVSSNLQFFINNNEVVQDNQTFTGLEGVSIRYVQSFEEVTSSSFAVGLLPYGATVSGMLAANPQVLYSSPLSYVDWRTGNKAEKLIYTAFDPVLYKNALNDFYGGAFLQYQEKMRQVNGLAKVSFDKYDLIIPVVDASSDVRTVIYNSESKAVILQDQRFPVVCTQGQIADIISKKCIDRTACTGQRYVFNSICVKQCPVSYRLVQILDSSSAPLYNICYASCPQWLGYRDPDVIDLLDSRNNTCVKCAAGQLAKQASCAATCQSPMFTFEKGCYATCPLGTVVAGLVCSQPTQASDCNTNYYVKLNDILPGQYYDICQASLPTDKYRDAVTANKFSWKCTGKVLLSGICDTTSALGCTSITDSLYKVVSNSLQGTKFCQMSCIDGLLNNSNTCSNQAEDLRYPQYSTGSSLTCDLTAYDTGNMYDRLNKVCVTSCNYRNHTKIGIICEQQTDFINCPKRMEVEPGIFQCFDKCPLNKLELSSVCISSCPADNIYIQLDGRSCSTSCQPGEMIKVYKTEVQCVAQCVYPFKVISQSVYGSYSQCIQIYTIPQLKGGCDWVFTSRIWDPQEMCDIPATIDFLQWTNYQTQLAGTGINMGVVNVVNLVQINTLFQAFNIPAAKVLKNGLLVVNVTIDMSSPANANLNAIKVCLFDQVLGSLNNISVTGFVNITNFDKTKTTSVVLSKLFGNVLLTGADRVVGGSFFTNVSSNLQFFINNNEVVQDNQTFTGLEGVSIRYVQSFEEVTSSSFAVGLLPYGATVSGMLAANPQVLYSSPLSYVDWRTGNKAEKLIYTAFDPVLYKNALNDFYGGAFLQYQEKMRQVNGLAKVSFDKYDLIIPVVDASSDVRTVIYNSESKAVILQDQRFPVVCTQGQIADIISKKCIDRTACTGQRYVFNSICVKQCPVSYRLVQILDSSSAPLYNICYASCPQWLGYRDPDVIDLLDSRNNTCVKCAAGQLAKQASCAATCQSPMFTFEKGCYATCPLGTVVAGLVCSQPTQASDCNTNYYVKLNDILPGQYYDVCRQNKPIYLFNDTNIFTWKCTGIEHINMSCGSETSLSCTNFVVQYLPVLTNFKSSCALSCIQNSINNQGVCEQTCDNGYPQTMSGSCNTCDNQQYDLGLYFNRKLQICQQEVCIYANQTNNNICEDPLNKQYCPSYSNNGASHYLCTACGLNKKYYQGACLDDCPDNTFLQLNGWQCDTQCNKYMLIQQAGKYYKCIEKCILPNIQLQGANSLSSYKVCSLCQNGYLASRDDSQCVPAQNCLYLNGTVCESNVNPKYCPRVQLQLNSQSNYICLSSCVGLLEYQKQCYLICPFDTFAQNDKCIKECAFYKFTLILGSLQPECDSQCSKLQFMNETNSKRVYSCIQNCPPTYYPTRQSICSICNYYDTLPNPNYCEDPLDNAICTYLRQIGNNYICLTTCAPTEFYLGKLCVTSCPVFVNHKNLSVCTDICGSSPLGYAVRMVNNVATNVCYDKCPSDKPNYESLFYYNTQQCIDGNCNSQGKYVEVNLKCTNQCASLLYVYKQDENLKFQCLPINSSCSKYRSLDNMKECYNSCPLGYNFQQGNECTLSCPIYMADPKSNSLKICIDTCGNFNPPYVNFDSQNRIECVSLCGDKCVFIDGRTKMCIQSYTAYTWDGSNKICSNGCTSFWIIDQSKSANARYCANSCDTFTLPAFMQVADGTKQCVSKCNETFPFQDGKECKAYCQYVSNQQLSVLSKLKCQVDQCTRYFSFYNQALMDTKICSNDCTGTYFYNFGMQCVQFCNTTANPYVALNGYECVKQCTGESAISIDLFGCDLTCNFYIDNNSRWCTDKCPSKYPFRRLYQVLFNPRYQCVDACLNYEYSQPTQNDIKECKQCDILFEYIGIDKHCLTECRPGQVRYKTQCYDGLCRDFSDLQYTTLDGNCSSTCSGDLVDNLLDKKCTKSCLVNQLYRITDGEKLCVSDCGQIYKNSQLIQEWYTDDDMYTCMNVPQCVTICPIGKFKALLQNGKMYKYCDSNCANEQYYVQIQTEYYCLQTCPIYEYNAALKINQCLDGCYQSKFAHKMYQVTPQQIQCVISCPDSNPFISNTNSSFCQPQCNVKCLHGTCVQQNYTYDGLTRTCITTCFQNLTQEYQFVRQNHMLCSGACNSEQVFYRYLLTQTGSCLKYCPEDRIFINPQSRECLLKCSPKYYKVIDQGKYCVYTANNCLDLVTYNRSIKDGFHTQCAVWCDQSTPFELQNLAKDCVAYCPPGTYHLEGKCLYQCTGQDIYALQVNLSSTIQQYNCTFTCKSGFYSTITTQQQQLFCNDTCDQPYVMRVNQVKGLQECLQQCDSNEYQHGNRQCTFLPCTADPTHKFVQNMICLQNCPKFLNKTIFTCIDTCEGMASGYIIEVILGQYAYVCYPTCSTNYIDLRSEFTFYNVGKCIIECSKSDVLYEELIVEPYYYCVTKCRDSQRFVQLDRIKCGATCPQSLFEIDTIGNNLCIQQCDIPRGRVQNFGIIQCVACPNYVSEVDQKCMDQCDYYNITETKMVCRMQGNTRNSLTCPIYTNDVTPFLCLFECNILRDGPWCVQKCSITGKIYVPEFGFNCQSSCETYYRYLVLFGYEQPQCQSTCDYMMSTTNNYECKSRCESNLSVFVLGRTYCNNCSSDMKLKIELISNSLKFTCQIECQQGEISPLQQVCTSLVCQQSIEINNAQQGTFTGMVCQSALFSLNYSTNNLTLNYVDLQIGKAAVRNGVGLFVLQNGTVFGISTNPNIFYNVNKTRELRNLNIYGAISVALLSGPPTFSDTYSVLLLDNGTFLHNNKTERLDFLVNEKPRDILGFYDKYVTNVSNRNINYLLTDTNLYFRGSCQSGLCGKNSDGELFKTTFGKSPYLYGIWTKIDLIKSGFNFTADQIDSMQAHEWALLFKLKNGQKYVYGNNTFNRLCSQVEGVQILNLTGKDQVYIAQNNTLFSTKDSLQYCGAKFSVDDYDYENTVKVPTNLPIQFNEQYGWKFSDNTIVQISAGTGGFMIRTAFQVFGIGKCIAFECYNFYGRQIYFSGQVQSIAWSGMNLGLTGNEDSSAIYYENKIVPVIPDIKEEEEEWEETVVIDIVNTKKQVKMWPYYLLIFIVIDIVAVILIIAMTKKIIKNNKMKKLMVKQRIRQPKTLTKIVKEVRKVDNVLQNTNLTADINIEFI
ncbi:Cysteine-rich_membrane protein 2 [Hexamita inflata]|uniref:Cysteine-rich membrane protein 2 n=1 Tax=Hexamita inflata TaxID=28002 RepID=A0AA86QF29_9EUKA|nr:Cysteine-rich membrane protein 2 [Hexamita inflata]